MITSHITSLEALQAEFGGRLFIGSSAIVDAGSDLAPEERLAVEHVTAARLREFSTGRAVARELLVRLGVVRPVVTRALDRSPLWPAGCVGSIAHTEHKCIVAVGRECDYRSVGIDIEPDEPIEHDLFDTIAVEKELEQFAIEARALGVRRLFVAKEAAYKCLHPVIGVFLDFHDITITIDGCRFTAVTRHPDAMGHAVEGLLTEYDGHVLALAALPAD